jgi:hypothetical protein
MKLAESTAVIESRGTQGSTSFGIRDEDMGVILGILRSKMYSDSIGSVVREIASNALDSHIAAGKANVPISIQIPNSLSSEFKVTDYGLGLSPEDIDRIYRNYGSSTKRSDNKQLGGYGIGSKSPFAYSDTFSIETNYEGTKYFYSAYIDESDRGKIFLLSSSPTLEGNGTTISIPVESKDFARFKDCTFYYTHYFPVRPKVIGTEECWPDLPIELEGEGWYIVNHNELTYNCHPHYKSSATVVVGSIPYVVESSRISFGDKLLGMYKRSLIFKCEIGEVSLPATREVLHYDERTISYIRERIKAIKEDLPRALGTYIQSAANIWEARVLLEDWSDLVYSCNKPIEWRGKSIPSSYPIPANVKVCTYERYNNRMRKQHNTSIKPYRNTVLIFNDISQVLKKDRLEACLEAYPKENLMFLSTPKGEVIDESVLPFTDIGGVLLSSIPYTPQVVEKVVVSSRGKKVASRKPKGHIEGFLYSSAVVNKSSRGMYHHMSPCVVDPHTTEGAYVEINAGTINLGIGTRPEINYMGAATIDNYIEVTGIQELYAFRPNEIPSLGDGWVPLKSLIEAKIEELRTSFTLEAYQNSRNLFSRLIGDIGMETEILKLDRENVLRKYLVLSTAMRNHLESIPVKPIIRFIEDFKTELIGDTPDETLMDLYKEAKERYPLFLPTLSGSRFRDSSKAMHGHIIKYIKLIDKEEDNAI